MNDIRLDDRRLSRIFVGAFLGFAVMYLILIQWLAL